MKGKKISLEIRFGNLTWSEIPNQVWSKKMGLGLRYDSRNSDSIEDYCVWENWNAQSVNCDLCWAQPRFGGFLASNSVWPSSINFYVGSALLRNSLHSQLVAFPLLRQSRFIGIFSEPKYGDSVVVVSVFGSVEIAAVSGELYVAINQRAGTDW